MGFYVTGHPLMNFQGLIDRYTNASCANLADSEPNSLVRIAGMVKKIKEINTKKGDRMAFVTLEDLTGDTEVTVFSDLYLPTRDLLQSSEPLMISGVREGDKESPKILAQEIYPMEEAPRRLSKGIQIKLSARGADPQYVKDLKQVLARHRGRLPVRLHIVIPHRTETIINLPSVSCDPTEAFLTEVRNTLGYEAVCFE